LNKRLTTPSQVHADASNFDDGVTKEDAFEQVLFQAEALFIDQRNWVGSPISPLVTALST
jgi:L-methionine (R)-S-oxide reductase